MKPPFKASGIFAFPCVRGMGTLRLALFASLVGCLLLPAAPALAQGGILAQPAYPIAEDPDTQAMVKLTIPSGEAKSNGIRIQNNTGQNRIFRFYAVDAEVLDDGSHVCAEPGSPKTGASTWLQSQQNLIKLAVGESQVMDFSVQVPAQTLPGYYNACIFIEEALPANDGSDAIPFRKGVRVHIRVPNHVVQKIAPEGFHIIEKVDAASERNQLLFISNVRNNGSLAADARVTVAAGPWYDRDASTVETTLTIPRHQTQEWRFEMEPTIWGGIYRAEQIVAYPRIAWLDTGNSTDDEQTAKVDGGSPLRWGANIAGVPAASAANGEMVELRSGTIWYITPPTPFALAVELVGLLALLALGWQLHRHRHLLLSRVRQR